MIQTDDKFKILMDVHKEYNSLLLLEMQEQIKNGLMMLMKTCYHSRTKSING